MAKRKEKSVQLVAQDFEGASQKLCAELFQNAHEKAPRFALEMISGQPISFLYDTFNLGYNQTPPLFVALRSNEKMARLLMRRIFSGKKHQEAFIKKDWADCLYHGSLNSVSKVRIHRKIMKTLIKKRLMNLADLVTDMRYALASGMIECARDAFLEIEKYKTEEIADAFSEETGHDYPFTATDGRIRPHLGKNGELIDLVDWQQSVNRFDSKDSWGHVSIKQTGVLAFLEQWEKWLAEKEFQSEPHHKEAKEFQSFCREASAAIWQSGALSSPESYKNQYLKDPRAGLQMRQTQLSKDKEKAYKIISPLLMECVAHPFGLDGKKMAWEEFCQNHQGMNTGFLTGDPFAGFCPDGQSPGLWSLALGGELFLWAVKQGFKPKKTQIWVRQGALKTFAEDWQQFLPQKREPDEQATKHSALWAQATKTQMEKGAQGWSQYLSELVTLEKAQLSDLACAFGLEEVAKWLGSNGYGAPLRMKEIAEAKGTRNPDQRAKAFCAFESLVLTTLTQHAKKKTSTKKDLAHPLNKKRL